MKKIMIAAAAALMLGLASCAAPQTAQTFLEKQEIDPSSLTFSAQLIHEDGTTETKVLAPAAQEALLSALPLAAEPAEDAEPVTAEQADAHHLTFEGGVLFIDASRTNLTFVLPVEQDGQTVYTQEHFVLSDPIEDLFPHAELAPDRLSLSTLDSRIAAADIAKLESDGELLEFSAFEGELSLAPKGNAFAILQEGSLIVGAQKISVEGKYLPMLVQEIELVDTTLIVRAAVSSDEAAGTVTLPAPASSIREVWFVESGTIIDIADPVTP